MTGVAIPSAGVGFTPVFDIHLNMHPTACTRFSNPSLSDSLF